MHLIQTTRLVIVTRNACQYHYRVRGYGFTDYTNNCQLPTTRRGAPASNPVGVSTVVVTRVIRSRPTTKHVQSATSGIFA